MQCETNVQRVLTIGLLWIATCCGAGLVDDLDQALGNQRPRDRGAEQAISEWIELVAGTATRVPGAVAEAAQYALFSESPNRLNLVVPNDGEAAWTMGSLVTRLARFDDHQFSCTTGDLLAMVRAAIGAVD